jgi:hypothetical protein
MQLILTHADLEAALINDLRNKGMTAFEPGKASVEFAFKRGTKELVCTLDTDPKPEAAADPKLAALASSATQTATGSAPVAQATASAPAEAAKEPVHVAEPETPATTTTEAPAEVATAAAGGDDDNLFD